MEIETNRLILREYKHSDIKGLALKINNLNVPQYLATVPYPYQLKDAQWFIKDCVEKRKKEPRVSYELAMRYRDKKELIGGIGLSNIDYNIKSAELGCWLSENYWRQGIMSEGLEFLINFAFKKLKLNRLIMSAYIPNIGSNKLAKKMGFKLEGTTRESAKPKSTGKIHDTNHWGLLKKEWKNNGN